MEEAYQDGFTIWAKEKLEERDDFLDNSMVRRKAEGWLRLMRGDELARVSKELCLSPRVLRQWQKRARKYI